MLKPRSEPLPKLNFEEAKDKVVADTAPTQRGGYPYDEAVIAAGSIAVLIQICFAIAIAGLFATLHAGNLGTVPRFWIGACVLAEFGMVLFLCHCVFLFPQSAPGKNIVAFGSLVVAGLQLVVVSDGYAIGPLFAYVVAICITGWFMHRVFGASLSMRGEEVFQDALSTKVLLLIAPLLLVMGLVPTLAIMILSGVSNSRTQPDFASTIVFAALTLLGLSIVPILTVYAGFCFLRFRNGGKAVAGILVLATALATIVFEWIMFNPGFYSLWFTAFASAYVLGLGVAYLPFHWFGFRPVWAKRKATKRVEASVSFDDIN